jgi:hypothetical protein
MDLNRLYHRRAIAVYKARYSATRTLRDLNGAFARLYEARIARFTPDQPLEAA